jgi:hypothetical protein
MFVCVYDSCLKEIHLGFIKVGVQAVITGPEAAISSINQLTNPFCKELLLGY